MPDVRIVFDGGSRGNGTRDSYGYGSYQLLIDGTAEIVRLTFGTGVTNNEAEYDTLLAALTVLSQRADASSIVLQIWGDSQLVIFQVKGLWKAKEPRLIERRDRVKALLKSFAKAELNHHLRAESVKVLGH